MLSPETDTLIRTGTYAIPRRPTVLATHQLVSLECVAAFQLCIARFVEVIFELGSVCIPTQERMPSPNGIQAFF